MFEQWVPLMVAIFGGVGVKVIESLISRSGKKIDMEGEIRKELRQVVADQDDKIEELSKEVDVWKNKYYDLLKQLIGYEELKVAHNDLKNKVDILNKHAKTLPDK